MEMEQSLYCCYNISRFLSTLLMDIYATMGDLN
jgi:hypothetical protein